MPKTASGEVCDHADNNCNVLIDEGLDNDQDGYGCNPNIQPGCQECVPGVGACTSALLCAKDTTTPGGSTWTGKWDCNDQDPSIYPGNPEICDGKDNNCNGLIDEGVLNACGTCDSSCVQTTSGGTGSPFTPSPTNSTNINQDANTGNLGLTTQNINTQFAWVSNDTAGTLSKIDTTSGKEVGRYCQALKVGVPTAKLKGGKDPTGATYDTRAEPTVCAACNGCNRGSRTTVNLNGDVFIANRAFGYQGNYSKVATAVQNCVDVNGDGVIETSKDVNGNGVIDLSNPNEYLGELDECILWTRRPTTWSANPNAAIPGTYTPLCVSGTWPTMTASTTVAQDQAACLAEPTGSCQFSYSCSGNGSTTCTSNGNELASACTGEVTGSVTGAPNWCTLTGGHCASSANVNIIAAPCSTKTTAATCNATATCGWAGTCAPTACTASASNSNKTVCNARTGCAEVESCYHVGVGYYLARAAAIDGSGWLWTGNFNYLGFFQVNPTTGYVQRWVYTGTSPYGAVIDKNGILWSPDNCCGAQRLVSVNINSNVITYSNSSNGNTTYQWQPLPTTPSNTFCVNSVAGSSNNIGHSCYYHNGNPGGSYGISVDGKNRVWVGGYAVGNYAGFRYDPSVNAWAGAPVTLNTNGTQNLSTGYGRGTTVDASGTVWIAQHGYGGSAGWWFNGRITGYNTDTLAVVQDVYLGTSGQTPIGVGIGYDGRIWSPAQSTSNIVVLDPNTGATAFYPVGGPPYTYSDFTGSILRTFTSPQGDVRGNRRSLLRLPCHVLVQPAVVRYRTHRHYQQWRPAVADEHQDAYARSQPARDPGCQRQSGGPGAWHPTGRIGSRMTSPIPIKTPPMGIASITTQCSPTRPCGQRQAPVQTCSNTRTVQTRTSTRFRGAWTSARVRPILTSCFRSLTRGRVPRVRRRWNTSKFKRYFTQMVTTPCIRPLKPLAWHVRAPNCDGSPEDTHENISASYLPAFPLRARGLFRPRNAGVRPWFQLGGFFAHGSEHYGPTQPTPYQQP